MSSNKDEERALRFLVDTVEYPRQEMVANKIRVLTQMMLWVHKICGGNETDQLFSRLNTKEMDRQTLGECAGTSEAMRLGWGCA